MPGLITNLNKNKLKRKPLAATARFIVMARWATNSKANSQNN